MIKNISEYYSVFIDFLDKGDDSRMRILNSPQLRIIYAYVRTKGFINNSDISSLYLDEKQVPKIIEYFINLGIIKRIAHGTYQYVEYKTAEEILKEEKEETDRLLKQNKRVLLATGMTEEEIVEFDKTAKIDFKQGDDKNENR